MEKMKEVIFIKGKESVVVNLLLLVAIIIFIVPIAMIFILRGVYRLVQNAKENVKVVEHVNARLEKVY